MLVRIKGKFDIECLACKTMFKVNYSRKDKAKFCSVKCTHDYQKKAGRAAWGTLVEKGQHVSPETEIKLGQRLSPKTEFKKGQAPWNKGLKTGPLSAEHKAKIGVGNKGLKRGPKHFNWQGGKSFEPYPPQWVEILKEAIRERDKRCCSLCGCGEVNNGRKLSVHHIDYDKANLDPDNLVSLCTVCHWKTNYNRKVWRRLFRVLQVFEIGFANAG